jgi:protein CpxP
MASRSTHLEIDMKQLGFRPILAGLTLALAAVTTVTVAAPSATGAATPAGDQSSAPHKGMGQGHHKGAMRGGLMIPGLGPIGKKQVDALKLTSAQQTQFKSAEDAQRDLMGKMHAAREAHRKAVNDQLAAGKLDPHALSQQSDQERGEFKSQSEAVRNQWLALWDSLSDGQRQQVAGFVKTREARMDKHRAEHRSEHRNAPKTAPVPAAG